MNLKEFFPELVSEGQFEDLARTKLLRANKFALFEPLSQLDKSPTKKHLPKLADYAIEGHPLETIKYYYERFLNSRLAGKDINTFKTFKEFETAIDAVPVKVGKKETVTLPSVYDDDNITVWRANGKADTITLSRGYTFCIGNPSAGGNMYYSYRFSRGSTFYFCRLKKRPQGDTAHYIVLDAGQVSVHDPVTYQITLSDNGARGGGTDDTTPEAVIKRFPEFKAPFEKGVFQPNPLGENEKEQYETVSATTHISYLPKYEDKVMFINLGKEITNADWTDLDQDLKRLYINVGANDLTPHMKNTIRGTGLEARYIETLDIRLQQKLGRENEIPLTPDETQFLKDDPNRVTIPPNKVDAKRILHAMIYAGGGTSIYRKLSQPKKNLYVYFLFYRLPEEENDPNAITGVHKSLITKEIIGSPQEIIFKKGIAHKIKVGERDYRDAETDYIHQHMDYYLPYLQKYGAQEGTSRLTCAMIFEVPETETEAETLIRQYFGQELASKMYVEDMKANYIGSALSSTAFGPLNHKWTIDEKIRMINFLGGAALVKEIVDYGASKGSTNYPYSLTKELTKANQMPVVKQWGLLYWFYQSAKNYPKDTYATADNVPVNQTDIPAGQKTNLAYLLAQVKYLQSHINKALSYDDKTNYKEKEGNWMASYRGPEHALQFTISLLAKIAEVAPSPQIFKNLFYKRFVDLMNGTAKLYVKNREAYLSLFGRDMIKTHANAAGRKLLVSVFEPTDVPDILKLFYWRCAIVEKVYDKLPALIQATPDLQLQEEYLDDITYNYTMTYGADYKNRMLVMLKPGDPIMAAFADQVLHQTMTERKAETNQYGSPAIYVNYVFWCNPIYYEMKRRFGKNKDWDLEPELKDANKLRRAENYNDYKSVILPAIVEHPELKAEDLLVIYHKQKEKEEGNDKEDELKEYAPFQKDNNSGFFRLKGRAGPMFYLNR